jgi:UDP-N-acetylmuramoylalanine--D-glutamate ligase
MKIAIAGYGVEGQANYRYWSKLYPDAQLTIVDENQPAAFPDHAQVLFGTGVFEQLQDFDLVIRTAGLAPHKIVTNGKIWSATNEFFEKCPVPIIGITGSKGKGTTASLIDSILRASGRNSWLVGNIGLPGLDVLERVQPGDLVVYELSSFQLWDLERSPSIAIVTIIEPDHLDVHLNYEEYVSAKSRITAWQTPDQRAYYRPGDADSQRIAETGQGSVRPYIAAEAIHVEQEAFYNGSEYICSTDSLRLPGAHNLDNACAAISAVLHCEGVTNDTIRQGLEAFRGLPHRLHFVKEVNGVKYYDDSIATTPSSAIAAVRAFSQPKVIILGGSYKGSDFGPLAEELSHHEDIRALLLGEEAPRIVAALQAANFDNFEIILEPTMEKVVRHAAEVAEPGSVVLLSPSAASFGLFKNYADRGDQFVAAVESL